MVGEKGYDSAILDALTRRGAWIVSKSSNANTITHYLSGSSEAVAKVAADLEEAFPGAIVSVRPCAMVAAIGSDISAPGLVSSALDALDTAGITVLALQHQVRNVDVQFIIERSDFETTVKSLHAALVEKPVAELSSRAAA